MQVGPRHNAGRRRTSYKGVRRRTWSVAASPSRGRFHAKGARCSSRRVGWRGTALAEVEPNQLLFDAPSEFFWLHTARRVAEARLAPVEAAVALRQLYMRRPPLSERRRTGRWPMTRSRSSSFWATLLPRTPAPTWRRSCSASTTSGRLRWRKRPSRRVTRRGPGQRAGYRWGDAAIDSVSSFGVPVRSRPTAALRRVDAAAVVDAEVAQKLPPRRTASSSCSTRRPNCQRLRRSHP